MKQHPHNYEREVKLVGIKKQSVIFLNVFFVGKSPQKSPKANEKNVTTLTYGWYDTAW